MEENIVYLVNAYMYNRDCSGHIAIRNKVFRKKSEAYKALKEVFGCSDKSEKKMKKHGETCYKIFKPGKINKRSIEDIINGVPYKSEREYIGEGFIIKMEIV